MPAVTLAEFREYVGTDEVSDFVESCLDGANAHVGRFIGTVDTVPNEIHRQAILICASELFHRRSSPQGIAQFATNDGSVARVARDPMIAVYPLLLPYVGYGV
jgi:hypothetical protein